MTSDMNIEKTKVNTRLSELARWILLNAGDGIERGDIIAGFYEVERLYIGCYLDPCFRPKERREHDRQNRYAQPRVTMTLKRLEKRGFVCLIRHRKYVKEVRLTEKGKAVAEELDRTADTYGDIK
jgi:DNA-binding transcriptional ArsR family regulator